MVLKPNIKVLGDFNLKSQMFMYIRKKGVPAAIYAVHYLSALIL